MAKTGVGDRTDTSETVSMARQNSGDEFADTFSLEWLFDPNNFDHLPVEEQLKLYKQRDLKKVKLYKWAARVWGKPPTRKRVIEAPPMYTSWQESSLPVKINRPPMNSQLKPQLAAPASPPEEEEGADDDLLAYKEWMKSRRNFRDRLEMMGLNEEWLARKPDKTPLEQRVLRRMMEEKYPRIPTPPVCEPPPVEAKLHGPSPVVRRPCPLAIRILEKFLREKKMRLIDLFASVDKDKNWKVSREEFRSAITKADIPISDVLLEDLILALDTDFNDQLDYRELAKGMVLWKIEKRESKRRLLASEEATSSIARYSKLHGLESPLKEDVETAKHSAPASSSKRPPVNSSPDQYQSSSTRIKSALSTISSASSQHLEPPEPDLRQEQMVLSSQEAMLDQRKRDREVLAKRAGRRLPKLSSRAGHRKKGSGRSSQNEEVKMVIKTGDLAVDNHCLPSTLGGENAELVDRFRQVKLQEYNEICKLCAQNDVPFTEELLKKVLLFPPDKPHSVLKRHLRQPENLTSGATFPTTISKHQKTFSKPQKSESQQKPAAEIASPSRHGEYGRTAPTSGRTSASYASLSEDKEEEGKGGAGGRIPAERADWHEPSDTSNSEAVGHGRKQKSRKTTQQNWQSYPTRNAVRPRPSKMNLSTGQAVVERKVDCWMTFEDYDHYTSKLEHKYTKLYGTTDYNAFWPGHLLDKVRLCMPETEPKSTSVFTSIQREHVIYPVNSDGLHTAPPSFIQYGLIGPPTNIYKR